MRVLFLIPGAPQEQLRLLPIAARVARQLSATLQVACPAASASVWALLPEVEKVLPFGFNSDVSLAEWTNLLGSIREPDFQACLNFAEGWNINLLLSLSHIPVRVARGGFACTAPLGQAAEPQDFLKPLGLSMPEEPFRLCLPAPALQKAVAQLPTGNGPLLVLAPTGQPDDWPEQGWRELEQEVPQKLATARVWRLRAGSPLQQAAQVASADVLVSTAPSAQLLASYSGVSLVDPLALNGTAKDQPTTSDQPDTSKVLQALGLS